MKLYKLYLLFVFKNALRFPKQALKIIPTLGILLIGLGVSLYQVLTARADASNIGNVLGLLPVFNLLILLNGLLLYGFFAKSSIVAARAADANLLMPAPLTPFQLHNFLNLKNMLGIVGLIFFSLPFAAPSVLLVLPNPWLLYPLFFSILLMVYSLSFVYYISKTSPSFVGRFLKWIVAGLYLVFTVLFISAMKHHGDLGQVLSLPYITYYPILGWAVSLMKAIMVVDFIKIMIFILLLLGVTVSSYYWAKSQTYYYYEEELGHVQKTEATFKRAYSGNTIELKTKFVKTSHQFRQKREKALLDMAWVRAGKNWFLSLGLLLKLVCIALAFYFVFSRSHPSLRGETLGLADFRMFILLYIAILAYMRFFSSGNKTQLAASEVYMVLLPVKPIYKLLYLHLVDFVKGLISSLGLTILVTVYLFLRFSSVTPIYILYIFMLTLLIESFDIIRQKIFNALTISFLGNFVRQIADLFILLGANYLIVSPILHLGGVLGFMLSLVIVIALMFGLLALSLRIYVTLEKGKADLGGF